AATYPERVRALVLVNTAARYIEDDGYPGIPRAFIEQFLIDNIDPDVEWTVADADDVRLIVASLADDDRFREWWTRASRRGASPATARAIVGSFVRADTRRFLAAISAPTLVLHAAENLFVPTQLGRYLGDHIPGAMFVSIDSVDNSMLGRDADL